MARSCTEFLSSPELTYILFYSKTNIMHLLAYSDLFLHKIVNFTYVVADETLAYNVILKLNQEDFKK